MATDDKKKMPAAIPAVNLADLAPAGYEDQVADAHRTGLLTPLYLPKFAALKSPEGVAREGFPMVLGWLDRVHVMPEQSRGKDDDDAWVPFNLLVRDLKMPTKGIRRNEIGELTEKSIVPVAAGGKILIPISGQLKVNQDILDCLLDIDYCYWIVVQCIGYRKVDPRKNAMADWEVSFLRDSKKQILKKKREGEFLLPDYYKVAIQNGDFAASIAVGELVGSLGENGVTSSGERFDTKTGEALPALGASAAS